MAITSVPPSVRSRASVKQDIPQKLLTKKLTLITSVAVPIFIAVAYLYHRSFHSTLKTNDIIRNLKTMTFASSLFITDKPLLNIPILKNEIPSEQNFFTFPEQKTNFTSEKGAENTTFTTEIPPVEKNSEKVKFSPGLGSLITGVILSFSLYQIKKLADSERYIQELKKKLKEAEEQKIANIGASQKLSEEIADAKKRIQELETKLKESKTSNKDSDESIQKLINEREELNNLKKSNSSRKNLEGSELEKKKKEKETEISEMKIRISQLELAIEKVSRDRQQKLNKINELERQGSVKENEILQLKKSINNLEEENKNLSNQLNKQLNAIKELEKRKKLSNEKLINGLAQKNAEIKKANIEIDNLNKQIERSKSLQSRLENEIKALFHFKILSEDLQIKIKHLQVKLESLEKKSSEDKESYHKKLLESHDTRKIEIEKLQNLYSESKKILEENLMKIASEKKHLEDKLEKIKQEKRNRIEIDLKKQKEIDRLIIELEKQREIIQKNEDELKSAEKLKVEVISLKVKLGEFEVLKERNAQLESTIGNYEKHVKKMLKNDVIGSNLIGSQKAPSPNASVRTEEDNP